MTLSTDIYITGTGVTHREVVDRVNDLLGIPVTRTVDEGPAPSHRGGDFRLDNAPGQGFDAWVMSDSNTDGSLITPAHDDDCAVEDGPCTSPYCLAPAHHVHLDLDTAYGGRSRDGWSCAELHGWVIAALIPWLTERGCSLAWVNEFAGTLHVGADGLDAFLGHGADAERWFATQVLPAVLAQAVSDVR